MWFSFPLLGRVRLGVRWWLAPFALAFYLVVVAALAPLWVLGKLLGAVGKARPRRQARPADRVKVTIHVADTPTTKPPPPQRPGEIG